MSTVQLNPGDQGLQWIEGVGFRPVDMTEELPGKDLCGFTDTGEQCETVQCSNEKWTFIEKWEPPIYDVPYIPEIFATPYIPVYQSNPPIDWHTPPTFWDPPTWTECCINVTPPWDPNPPFDPPSQVSLPPTLVFTILWMASLLVLRRFQS